MANKEYTPNVPPVSKDIEELKRFLVVELRRITDVLKDIDKRLKGGGL